MSITVIGADVEFMKFSAGEPHVKVKNIQQTVKVIWKFENFEELMYVGMIAGVVASHEDSPKFVLELPYVPFARQDRATTPEQPFSLSIFCKFLVQILYSGDEIIVRDVHSDVFLDQLEYFACLDGKYITLVNSFQFDCACACLPDDVLINPQYDCIIAPDKGACNKAALFAASFEVPLVHATKVRDPLTGKLSGCTIDFGDLKPKRALIPDDILDFGGTFIQLANEVKKQFPDIKLDLYITHGIFAAGREELNKRFENIYCYNDMGKTKESIYG